MIFRYFRRSSQRLKAALAVLLSIELGGTGLMAQALPDGGVVRAGAAQISTSGAVTRIDQASDRAIIDWRTFAIGAGGQVVFVQPSAQSATLNRVTGDQVSIILGRLDANGQVFLVNPNGIVFGGGAQINVGSLVASTSNLSNTNFMAGKLVFDQPGRPGAGILNAGAMTAAEGGLVALVASHVRNDGVIVARLGKVMLGAADTFTVDLYGDGLINLALSDIHAGQLRALNGEPVTSLIANAGSIDTAGGRTVLMTARNAKNVLDNLINMSGTIKADSAVQQGGRILLLGEGGKVEVSGTLSARGVTGGAVEVLGDQVHLASTTTVDASGARGGGMVHVGGAFQGQGDTYRSSQTTVDTGATLKANAGERGDGGEVVVWSDGRTAFSGAVEATGGANGGNGGRLEVSGKGTLEFLGKADASANAGQAGSLLLDPAFLEVGAIEAGAIARVLRTGTSTNLAADVDITVNSAITGGDRIAGGGLTMTAGNNININDFVVTNDGAINLLASKGSVNVAAGKAVYAGSAPITVSSSGSVHTAPLVTSGALSIASVTGSVYIDSFIDGHTGPVNIRAAGDVDINQPIVNLAGGSALDVAAGQDVNVNALVIGSGGVAGGAVKMSAARDLNVNESIVTDNGNISLAATNGSIHVADGQAIVAGSGAVAISARGDITSGALNGGTLAIASAAGSVTLDGLIDSATGDTRISAATDVTINQLILNGRSGGALAVDAGRDVNLNAQIDGRGDAAGGAVALTAARSLNLNQSITTNKGAIALTAGNDLALAAVGGGALSAKSNAGTLTVNGVIDGTTGPVSLAAGLDVQINQPVLNPSNGTSFSATAGRDVIVNAQIDGRGGASGGSVALTASRDVTVNSAVVTNNGAIDITASNGAANMARGTALVSGSGSIAITAGSDVTTSGISGGSFAATSNGGSVNVNGVIDSNTGHVELSARRDVNINQPVLSLATGNSFVANAGNDINVNASIDGTTAARGGSATLAAGHDVKVNTTIATRNGAVNISAAGGSATVGPNAGVFTGSGAIGMTALGNVTTGILSGGPINVVSKNGSVVVSGAIAGNGGAMTIGAGADVNVAHAITNAGTLSPLTITAGSDINVNAAIDGRTAANGPSSAVTLTAGQNVNLNQSINTQDAAISVTAAQGTVTTAATQGLFAGSGDILVESGQTLSTGITSTTGTLTLRSTNGSVNVNTPINGETGAVTIAAANDVNVNQAISNQRGDAPLSVSAGHDIIVNAAVNGRDPGLTTPSGSVTMTAGNNVAVNESIATNNAAIGLTATGGTINIAAAKGLFAGTAPVTLLSAGDLSTGNVSAGGLSATSTAGTVTVNGVIAGSTGQVTLNAGQDVQINQAILSPSSGLPLTVTAGRDVLVNGQIDGRNGVTGGTVTLSASRDVAINNAVITNNGAIAVTATRAATMSPTATLASGTAAITMTTGGDATVGGISGGSFSASSSGGSVNVNGVIGSTTGRVDLTAATDVNVNQAVTNLTSGAAFNATAGNNINVNAQIDGSAAVAPVSGAATLTAGNNLNVNAAVVTKNAAITASATNGSANIDANAGLFAGTGAIALNALGNVTTGSLRGGTINVASSGGSVAVNGSIAGTGGAMTIGAATSVDIAQSIANPGTTSPLTITAGTDINVNGQIDGRTALNAPSSTVTLTAGQNVNLNDTVNTTDAAINVTATNGTVATGIAGGLFAGAGAITVQSGATLNTGTVDTTGALTFRSTNGSVNVATEISGNTGTETIQAAVDVNVNAGISNKRTGSTLAVTAGNDINVNATIDGRDAVLPGSSGTVNLTAGNNIGVNQNIVTRNSAIALTATNGTITAAGGGVGLFAGNATISETAGQTLDTGITETTGAVNLTSTGGGVNVNTAIPDTTGAVTINAATAVNINQSITNLKTGSNLAITAGTDINVLAQVDGRSGTAAGGTVTMTAGNNLNVVQSIATNDGAIALTATTGSVTLPVATEVIAPVFDPISGHTYDQIVATPDGSSPMQASILAGNAPVTITSGGNFTLTSPVKTTGALTITSTNGDVTTAAPIDDQTGVVTLTAGDALVVNREIRTNSQAITLNAGAGGITINQINDYDYTGTSSVNPKDANLTLNSVGNVSILDDQGVATTQTLTIDTRSQILTGKIGYALTSLSGRPQSVILNADGGIVSFSTGYADSINATSSDGSITLNVSAPGQLRITTGTVGTLDCPTCNINLSSSSFDASIGPDVVLNAGGSVNLSTAKVGTLDATARNFDVNFQQIIANQLTATAGQDVNLSASPLMWIGNAPLDAVSGGPLTLTAGRNIVTTATSPIHVGNGQTFTLTAGQNVTLNLLETLGAVNITATNGNVTLNNDIGPHIFNTQSPGIPDFNPTDKGVASLTISAPAGTAAITMQGARAEGNVVISTGGSLTAAKAITSVGGSVSITAPTQTLNQAVPIGTQNQVLYPVSVSPVIPPGPKAPLPGAPGLAGNGGSGAPALVDIPVAPADSIVAGVNTPGAANGNIGLPATPGGGSAIAPGGTNGTTAVAGVASASSTGAPGSATGSVGVNGVSGGNGAPAVQQARSTSVPGTPTAPAVASASSTNAGPGADTAAALRSAEEGCGKEDQREETGLQAIEPTKPSQPTVGKNAACNAAPADETAPAATAPAQPPVPPAAAVVVPPVRSGGTR
jgi:filamentous hemagglutinin family protein